METILTLNSIPENTTFHFLYSDKKTEVVKIEAGPLDGKTIELRDVPLSYRVDTKYADKVLRGGKDEGCSWVNLNKGSQISVIDQLVPDFLIIDEPTKGLIFPARTLIENLHSVVIGDNERFPVNTLQGAYIRTIMLSSIMESAAKSFLHLEDKNWMCLCGKDMSMRTLCPECKKSHPVPKMSKSSSEIINHVTLEGHEWLSFFNLNTEERSVKKSELGVDVDKLKTYYEVIGNLRNKLVHQLSIEEDFVLKQYEKFLSVNNNGCSSYQPNIWEKISHIALHISVDIKAVILENEVLIIDKIKKTHYKDFCEKYYPSEIENLTHRNLIIQTG